MSARFVVLLVFISLVVPIALLTAYGEPAAGGPTGTLSIEQTQAAMSSVRQVAAIVPFFEDFESGTLSPYWESTGTNNYRTQVITSWWPHSGSYHLTMDSSSGYSRNELTLVINLANHENVELSFWMKEFGDDDHGPPSSPFIGGADFDGVAISADGNTWYEVQGLRSADGISGSYSQFTVNLDAAIATYGLSYNSTFRIRFNHYDNGAIDGDGFAFDDISVTGRVIDDLQVTPYERLDSAGPEAGPFSPAAQSYVLTNTGLAPLNWTATKTATWLLLSNTAGTLDPAASDTVEVSINANAHSLPAGLYNDTVSIINTTSGINQIRPAQLRVLKPVLAYIQYADTSPYAEYFNTLYPAILSVNVHFGVTELTDYAQLSAMLPGHNVLLIPEQEKASASQLETIGAAWATTLWNFVYNGGVVIQCDYNGKYGILTGAGLMSISASGNFYDQSVTVVAPGDPVAQGVSSSYNASYGSSYYFTSEGPVVVERTSYGPVVINKRMGRGHVVLIGHDYSAYNADQNRIVGNAVFNLFEMTSRGQITLNREYYHCADSIGITVRDLDLAGSGNYNVYIDSSTESIRETVTLVETSVPGIFGGIIATDTGSPITDGKLQVAHGDSITAYYYDEDDGSGNAIWVAKQASVDCQPPLIGNVNLPIINTAGANISWDTDELSNSVVWYGLSCGSLTESTYDLMPVRNHTIVLSGLEPSTDYFFAVESTDRAGNTASDDNGGSCYQFTTLDVVRVLWDVAHTGGNPPYSYYMDLFGDNPQALFIEFSVGPFTAADLADIDIYVLCEPEYMNQDEIGVIRNFLNTGRSMLLMSDEGTHVDIINAILTGSGLSQTGSSGAGTTTDISETSITEGVRSFYQRTDGASFTGYWPGQAAIRYYGQTIVALSEYGSGTRVVVAADEDSFRNGNYFFADNEVLMRNILNWLGPRVTPWDVVITELGFNPSVVNSGELFTVSFTIENQGTGDAGGSWTEIWVSRTGVVDRTYRFGEACFYLASQWIAPLASGESRDYTLQVSFPFKPDACTYGGAYYLVALTDVINEIAEGIGERNNKTLEPLQVGCAGVDLGFSDIRFMPEVVHGGDSFVLAVEIFNFGSLPSGVSDCAFIISADAEYQVYDRVLSLFSVAPLTARCSTLEIRYITFPTDIPPGEYYIAAIIDYSGAISECNEENNLGFSPQKLVVAGQPDLIVKEVKIDKPHLSYGDSFTLTAEVGNFSDVASGGCWLEAFLSEDERIVRDSDHYLGSLQIPALAPGASYQQQLTLSYTLSLPPGAYYLGAMVDVIDEVAEISETDNCGIGLGKISVGDVYYDLHPSLVGFDTLIWPGKLTLRTVVENLGLYTTKRNWIEFYLSPDRAIFREELLRDNLGGIVSEYVPQLGHQEQYEVIKNIDFPTQVAPGKYYVGAVCDVIDDQLEDNEYNNQNVASERLTIGTINRDLIVDIVSVSHLVAEPMDSLTYLVKVENTGTQPVGSCWIECFLSQDRDINRWLDIYLGSFNTWPGLAPGASQLYVMRSSIPLIPPGEYYLTALLDVIKEVPEDNESNNYCLYFWKIRIE